MIRSVCFHSAKAIAVAKTALVVAGGTLYEFILLEVNLQIQRRLAKLAMAEPKAQDEGD